MNDICNFSEWSIEEKKCVLVTDPSLKCEDGWTLFRKSCYFVPQLFTKRSEAEKNCKNLNAELMVVNDDAEFKFLKEFYSSSSVFRLFLWVIFTVISCII